MHAVFERHLEARPVGTEQPAVIRTAQSVRMRDTVTHFHAAVGAAVADQAVFAALRFVERQVFAHDAHAAHGVRIQFRHDADRVPVLA